MERRAVLKLVALAALSPRLDALESAVGCSGHAQPATPAAGGYELQFFSQDENQVVDQLMEMIIPADAHSPGAHAAQASLFADQMIANSDDALKARWRQGLVQIRQQAKGGSLADALRQAAANEENPRSDLDHFFVLLKQTTVDGYYTSQIGIEQELEYTGNTYLVRFPECTHPEHKG